MKILKQLYKKLDRTGKRVLWTIFTGLFIFGATKIKMSQVEGLIAALAGKQQNLEWVNVMDYGADSTGVSDNSAAFDAAEATLTNGGVIYIPEGIYLFTATWVIDKPIIIQGAGSARHLGFQSVTKITCTTNINVWELRAAGIVINNVGMEWMSGSKATSAKGMYVKNNDPSPIEYFQRFTMNNVTVRDFYDNIYVERSANWTIDNSQLLSAERYNIHIENTYNQDGGDWKITNTLFYQFDADSLGYGVHQTGAGGGKMVNCKFNGELEYCYYVNLSNASTILLISNTSFENFTRQGIYATNTNYITVTGCEFAPYRSLADTAIIYFNGISGCVISGNTFVGTGGGGNKIYKINGGSDNWATGNSYSSYISSAPYSIYGGTNNYNHGWFKNGVVAPSLTVTGETMTGTLISNGALSATTGTFTDDVSIASGKKLLLPNTTGTARGTQLYNYNITDNFTGITSYPTAGTNVATALSVIPKGTGYSSTIKAQFAIYNTDYIADATNYEFALFRATGTTGFGLMSAAAGTGTQRPFFVDATGGQTQATANINFATTGRTGIGAGVTSPTAILQLKAGTATASTAPLKFTSGTNLTTGETGAMEYNGTNLFFTRTGTTRETVITANAVNSVSPTAPNRTITVVIDGTTYYIHAKTTND
ncbi:MAG: glycosyl hydrolase family 28-related protein [Bacteroidota bacterium]